MTLRKNCCVVVNSRSAAWSFSSITTFKQIITYGLSKYGEGSKFLRYKEIATSICLGAKCEAKTYGKPKLAANLAESVDEPKIYIGTFVSTPGIAFTWPCWAAGPKYVNND